MQGQLIYLILEGFIFLSFLCPYTNSSIVELSKSESSWEFSDEVMLGQVFPTFYPDDFSTRNLVISSNLSVDTFDKQSQSSITKIHIISWNEVLNYLSNINEVLLKTEGIGWRHNIFLLIDKAIMHDPRDFIFSLKSNISVSEIPNLDINSDVFVVFLQPEVPVAYEIYVAKAHLYIKPVILKWTDDEIEVLETTVSRRRDLQGILINGVTQDDPTLELIATFEYVDGIPQFHSGVSVLYFYLMAGGLNFTVGAVPGTGWISQAPNGSLLGMAKQLQSGEADILIAFSELLPYRLNGLRFIHPYYRGSVKAFFQQPPPSEIRNIFFHPLQFELWMALLALWIFVVLSLKFIYEVRVTYVVKKDAVMQTDKEDQELATDAFLWGISSACGQGWYTLPHCGEMKIIMLSGLMTFIFAFTAYSAAIVTTLSLFLAPIKTWPDLANSGFKIYGDSLLQSSASITNKSGRPTFIPNQQVAIGVIQALKRFESNEPIAFISVGDQFYQISSKSNYTTEFICQRVSHVPVEGNLKVKGGMAINKTSPFKKLFNYQTLLIQERGLDSRLSYHYKAQYTPNCLDKHNKFDTYILGISDVFTAFAILLFAFVTSTLILIWERTCCQPYWLCNCPRKVFMAMHSFLYGSKVSNMHLDVHTYLRLIRLHKIHFPFSKTSS